MKIFRLPRVITPSLHLPILLLGLVFGGCFQQIAVSSLGRIMDDAFTVLNEESDLALAEASIASNLKLLEAIIEGDRENEHFLLLACIGYSSYALAFVEDDSAARAAMFYERGKNYGMDILRRNRNFAEAQTVDEFRSSLESFGKDDVAAIFWTAVGWGNSISLNLTDPEALTAIPRVEAMMEFVARTEPTYFYGGSHFVLGTLSGSRPPILGGNPERSKQHFEECLRINRGGFLMTYVYYARSYAVQTMNEELFTRCLTIVDTTSIDILPEARLTNAVAKKKARLLRERIGDLF